MESNYNLPVNIGNPNEISIKKLSDLLINLTNSISQVVYVELPKDDPTNRKPDISLAKKILKWKPEIDLEEGLIKTIEFLKTKL